MLYKKNYAPVLMYGVRRRLERESDKPLTLWGIEKIGRLNQWLNELSLI